MARGTPLEKNFSPPARRQASQWVTSARGWGKGRSRGGSGSRSGRRGWGGCGGGCEGGSECRGGWGGRGDNTWGWGWSSPGLVATGNHQDKTSYYLNQDPPQGTPLKRPSGHYIPPRNPGLPRGSSAGKPPFFPVRPLASSSSRLRSCRRSGSSRRSSPRPPGAPHRGRQGRGP